MISLHACSMGTHRKGCFHARVVVLIWYGQMLKKTVLRWQRYLLSMRLAMRPVKKKFIACTRRTFVWVAVFFYQNLWEHVWSERVPTANQHAFGTGRSVFNHSFVLFNFFLQFLPWFAGHCLCSGWEHPSQTNCICIICLALEITAFRDGNHKNHSRHEDLQCTMLNETAACCSEFCCWTPQHPVNFQSTAGFHGSLSLAVKSEHKSMTCLKNVGIMHHLPSRRRSKQPFQNYRQFSHRWMQMALDMLHVLRPLMCL